MTPSPASSRTVVVVGDVTDVRVWSGTAYHFWKAAADAGFAAGAGKLPLDWMTWPRRRWAAARALRGRAPSGYQYSDDFATRAEARLGPGVLAGEVVAFHHFFPRARTVAALGGRISYYLDAPLAALATGRGLDLKLPPDVVKAGLKRDRENFALADGVVTMARWAADVVVNECGVPATKVFTILPGANLDLPAGWVPPAKAGRAGKDRPFALGFVGADWARKGLPLLLDVRDELARRGWKAEVRAAGNAPPELARRDGMRFAGYLDKRDGTAAFVDFLAGCDVGCLFSAREALGISTLEFLRAGVPVAGYAVEGPADTLPADAGFRFPLTATAATIADRFEAYLKDDTEQAAFAAAAWRHSPCVTWDRCVREFRMLWDTGALPSPFRLAA